MLGPFEELPDEVVRRIFLTVHKHHTAQIHAFIVKYVPDPCVKPRRFFDFYRCDRLRRYTCFCRRNTRMETLLVHNLIHNPLSEC